MLLCGAWSCLSNTGEAEMPKDEQGWMANVDAKTYAQHLEKRVSNGERRPVVHNASDLLGPGFAPYVIEVIDWGETDDRALITGFYSANFGLVGAPEGADRYVFQTIAFKFFDGVSASEAVGGRQIAYRGSSLAVPPAPPTQYTYMRSFNIILGVKRFSAWV